MYGYILKRPSLPIWGATQLRWCHTVNMQPKLFIRPVTTPAFISWMEDIIYYAPGQVGYFPHAGLMELLVFQGRGVTMGTSGVCKVTLASLELLHFI